MCGKNGPCANVAAFDMDFLSEADLNAEHESMIELGAKAKSGAGIPPAELGEFIGKLKQGTVLVMTTEMLTGFVYREGKYLGCLTKRSLEAIHNIMGERLEIGEIRNGDELARESVTVDHADAFEPFDVKPANC